jgi:hypothetical protein
MEHQNQDRRRSDNSKLISSSLKSCDSASYFEHENEHDEQKRRPYIESASLARLCSLWLASRVDRFLEGNVGVFEELEQLRV